MTFNFIFRRGLQETDFIKVSETNEFVRSTISSFYYFYEDIFLDVPDGKQKLKDISIRINWLQGPFM